MTPQTTNTGILTSSARASTDSQPASPGSSKPSSPKPYPAPPAATTAEDTAEPTPTEQLPSEEQPPQEPPQQGDTTSTATSQPDPHSYPALVAAAAAAAGAAQNGQNFFTSNYGPYSSVDAIAAAAAAAAGIHHNASAHTYHFGPEYSNERSGGENGAEGAGADQNGNGLLTVEASSTDEATRISEPTAEGTAPTEGLNGDATPVPKGTKRSRESSAQQQQQQQHTEQSAVDLLREFSTVATSSAAASGSAQPEAGTSAAAQHASQYSPVSQHPHLDAIAAAAAAASSGHHSYQNTFAQYQYPQNQAFANSDRQEDADGNYGGQEAQNNAPNAAENNPFAAVHDLAAVAQAAMGLDANGNPLPGNEESHRALAEAVQRLSAQHAAQQQVHNVSSNNGGHHGVGSSGGSNKGTPPPKRFACPKCNRAFARAYNLNTHLSTHDPDPARAKPFPCPYPSCKSDGGRSFSRKHDLQRHVASVHEFEAEPGINGTPGDVEGQGVGTGGLASLGLGAPGKKFRCQDCGRGFVRRDALKRHHCEHANRQLSHNGPQGEHAEAHVGDESYNQYGEATGGYEAQPGTEQYVEHGDQHHHHGYDQHPPPPSEVQFTNAHDGQVVDGSHGDQQHQHATHGIPEIPPELSKEVQEVALQVSKRDPSRGDRIVANMDDLLQLVAQAQAQHLAAQQAQAQAEAEAQAQAQAEAQTQAQGQPQEQEGQPMEHYPENGAEATTEHDALQSDAPPVIDDGARQEPQPEQSLPEQPREDAPSSVDESAPQLPPADDPASKLGAAADVPAAPSTEDASVQQTDATAASETGLQEAQ